MIDADVFLSHSHKDEKTAIAFAGFLKKEFELNTFIDSCVWGYANDLLKRIDDTYCRQAKRNRYNYDKRNISTTHVHILLNSALAKMIDNTECIMFLNTPNSLSLDDELKKQQTGSPWIYSELLITSLIKKKNYRKNTKTGIMHFEESLEIVYDLPLDNLIELNCNQLMVWKNEYKSYRKNNLINALDILYNDLKS